MLQSSRDSSRAPTRTARLTVALLIGVTGGALCYANHLTPWARPGDFAQNWFAAREILTGQNPYLAVGPGLEYDWPWPLYYPATSFIIAIPFLLFSRLWATVVFAAVSSALLAYAVTATDWAKVPMFGSAAFIFAAGSAQWSPLFTAAMTLPFLAIAFSAKPTIGIALLAAAPSKARKFALYGAIVAGVLSLLLMPSWISYWLSNVAKAPHIVSPILRRGGFVILLCLMRWRRGDARLVLAMSMVPQTGAWYEALPLFLVPETRNQSMLLAALSCAGFLLYYGRMDASSDVQVNADVGALIVALVYLPATIMILRRPNIHSPVISLEQRAPSLESTSKAT